MQNLITVRIFNWNCLKNSQNMVISVDGNNKLILDNLDLGSTNQLWTMVPNLVLGAQTGGFTFFNNFQGIAAEQPASGQQIFLNNDPDPFGSAAYCWTLWPAGTSNNEQLWAIQSCGRGDAMDAAGGSCSSGTQVLFWGWNNGDNQRWVIRLK